MAPTDPRPLDESADEVARRWSCSGQWVRTLAKQGRIPAEPRVVRGQTQWFFPRGVERAEVLPAADGDV